MTTCEYKGILIIFHCPENTGYAIKSLEQCFLKVAEKLVGDNIHLTYTKLNSDENIRVETQPSHNIISFNPGTNNPADLKNVADYVQKHSIDTVLCFDQPPGRKFYKCIRKAGVKKIVSYWGAPISSKTSPVKLLLKKIEMLFRFYSPDLYIFESKAMLDGAIHGRGISKHKATICYLGVDTNLYKPDTQLENYAYDVFNIVKDRKIFFYSGHMEERKGVKVLIQAAIELADNNGRDDFHFIILGNKNNEERPYLNMLKHTKANEHVTFGGYRDDIASILPGCYAGMIASTGWDSFTMSSLEIAASGTPLIVSNLQGLVETVENEITGLIFEPGNYIELAHKIEYLVDNIEITKEMSVKSRERIINRFSKSDQIKRLYNAICQN